MKRSLIICALPLAALAAGCGGGSSSSSGGGGPYGTAPAASTTTAPKPAAPATVIATKPSHLGTILTAGGQHMTVYLFSADTNGSSACTGACASVWPPVTTTAAPAAAGAADSTLLGTIHRADGSVQVTYGGHPLYFYAQDGDAGDAYGQGIVSFGGGWYVVSPAGKQA